MSNRVVKAVSLTVVALAVVIGMFMFSPSKSVSEAQDKTGHLQELLQQLVEDNVSFLIEFTAPVFEGQSYWTVPGEIKHDGDVIGRLVVREVGDDYICVNEIGQGATTAICVPFSNVAYVTYTP